MTVCVRAETTVLANDLKKDDFKVVSLHPGFVQTDMGANASDLMSPIRPGVLAKLLLLHVVELTQLRL